MLSIRYVALKFVCDSKLELLWYTICIWAITLGYTWTLNCSNHQQKMFIYDVERPHMIRKLDSPVLHIFEIGWVGR